jgi:hypothetical protein
LVEIGPDDELTPPTAVVFKHELEAALNALPKLVLERRKGTRYGFKA